MKLSDEASAKAKELPMIMMLESFDISNCNGTYNSISHNDEFSRLIGYTDYSPTINNLYNGFHIFAFVYTKNWLNYYVRLLRCFKLNSQYMEWQSHEVGVKDKNGEDIPGYFEYFRQTYFENFQLFEEHYTVFHKYRTDS